jgi:hypothetical protein
MKNKLAVASLILGIISLLPIFVWIFPVGGMLQFRMIGLSFLSVLTSPVGLILGIISFFTIKKEKTDGLWMSVLGSLFSIVGLIMIAFIIAGMFGAMSFL